MRYAFRTGRLHVYKRIIWVSFNDGTFSIHLLINGVTNKNRNLHLGVVKLLDILLLDIFYCTGSIFSHLVYIYIASLTLLYISAANNNVSVFEWQVFCNARHLLLQSPFTSSPTVYHRMNTVKQYSQHTRCHFKQPIQVLESQTASVKSVNANGDVPSNLCTCKHSTVSVQSNKSQTYWLYHL